MFIFMSFIGADGELSKFYDYYCQPENNEERTKLVWSLLFSGLSAFWISYASAWCMRVTNSTTYSMVGSLNKLPIALSGLMFFPDKPVTFASVGSIFLGFFSGIIYTVAKLRYDEEQRRAASTILPMSSAAIERKSEEKVNLWKVRELNYCNNDAWWCYSTEMTMNSSCPSLTTRIVGTLQIGNSKRGFEE